MDRGLLSQPEVIIASRQFVCIRVPTYEDKSVETFTQRLFVGRSGNVENTTFALLSPDAEEKLVRAGRSPQDRYATPAEMAKGLREIAAKYPAKAAESLLVVVWVAVGGRGTIVGAVVGALAINVLYSQLTSLVPKLWPFILGGLFVSVVLFLPDGLIGAWRRLLARVRGVHDV